jgi:hypothetical protein
MALRPIDLITRPYDGASLQIRKKSRILAGCALGFGILSLAFSAFMVATKAAVVAAVFGGIAAFCAVVIVLIRTKRYHLASSLFLYGIFLAMFVAIKFDAYVNVYETYVFGTLGCFLLVVTTLVADRPSQALAIAVLDILAIQGLYWLDSYPVDGQVSVLAIQNLVVPCILTAIGGFAASKLVSMTTGLITEVEARASEASRSYSHLNSAMNTAQASSQSVGERLSAGMTRSIAAIAELREKMGGIAKGMDGLSQALGASLEANGAAVEKQNDVKQALDSYSREVAQASASIEQMAAAAAAIGSQAAGKKEEVAGLSLLATSGEDLLRSMNASIVEILEASNRMVEMNVFIGDVVDRTNLLGMNASIEAAHAGVVGKGFAVVADQIRALSVEAGNSSRVISETLKKSQAAVKATAARNAEAMDFFHRISEEIRGVSVLLEELLANVAELSAGSDDVLAAVGRVAQLTDRTEMTVADARKRITESSEGLASVASIAEVVHGESAAMVGRFDAVRGDVAEVERLGGENLATIRRLKASLEGFEAGKA